MATTTNINESLYAKDCGYVTIPYDSPSDSDYPESVEELHISPFPPNMYSLFHYLVTKDLIPLCPVDFSQHTIRMNSIKMELLSLPQFNACPHVDLLGVGKFADSLNHFSTQFETLNEVIQGVDIKEVNTTMRNLNLSGVLDTQFLANVNSAASTIRSGSLSLESAKDIFTNLLSQVPENWKTFVGSFGFIGMCFFFYKIRTGDTDRKTNFIGFVLSSVTVVLSSGMFSQMYDLISKLFSQIEDPDTELEPAPHISMCLEDAVRPLIIFFSSYATICTGKSVTDNAFKHLSSYNRVFTNAMDIIKYVVTLIETCVNLCREHILKQSPNFRMFSHGSSAISTVLDNVDKINGHVLAGTFFDNEHNYDFLCDTLEAARILSRTLYRDPSTANMLNELVRVIKQLEDMVKEMHIHNIGLSASRAEPVSILIRGGAGVAKSINATHMQHYYLSKVDGLMKDHIRENPGAFIYHADSDKYHDTYNSHKHIIYFADDWGQEKDSVNAEDSYVARFIKMVNSAPMPLRCADVDKKGNSYFRSELCFYTSNINKIDTTNIICPDAVHRRFAGTTYTMVPKPEYSLTSPSPQDIDHQRFDMSKLPHVVQDGIVITDLLPDQCYLYPTNIKGEMLPGGPYTWQQVMDDVIRRVAIKKAWHARQQDVLADIFKDSDIIQMEEVTPHARSQWFNTIRDTVKPIAPGITDEDILKHYDPEVVMAVRNWMRSIAWYSNPDGQSFVRSHFLMQFIEVNRIHGSRWDIYNPTLMLTQLIDTYGAATLRWLEDDDLPTFELYLQDHFTPIMTKNSFKAIHLLPLKDRVAIFFKNARDFLIEKGGRMLIFLDALRVSFTHNYVHNPIFHIVINTYAGILGSLSVLAIFDQVKRFFKTRPKAHGDVYDGRVPVKVKDSAIIKAKALARVPKQNMGADVGGDSRAASIVRRNMYQIDLAADPDFATYDSPGYLTFVTGTLAMCNFHFVKVFYAACEEKEERWDYGMRFTRIKQIKDDKLNRASFSCTVKEFLSWHTATPDMVEQDVCFIHFPIERTTIHPDISDLFVKQSFIDQYEPCTPLRLSAPIFSQSTTRHVMSRLKGNLWVGNGGNYWIKNTVEHTGGSSPGDCGMLVTTKNSKYFAIIGIHSAGVKGSDDAWSSVITSEMFKEWELLFPDNVTLDETHLELEPTPHSARVNAGQFTEVGTIPRHLTPSDNPKIDITRSKLYGMWNHNLANGAPAEAPAPINKIHRDPAVVENMYHTYCTNPNTEPSVSVELNEIADRLLVHMRDVSKVFVTPRILTYQEAVSGLEYDSDWSSISRSTSPGWPHIARGLRKNSDIFGREVDFDFSSPVAIGIEDECIFLRRCWQNSIRRPIVYRDFPKCERLSIIKVMALKCRLISGVDVVFLICVRRLFGSFMLWIFKNRIHNGCALGINPYGNEWELLVRKLQEVNPTDADAGDYKGFDGSLFIILMWCSLHLIQAWYGDEHFQERKMSFLEIVYSYHLFDGDIVEWLGSMPSGNPLTSIINCLCNLILMRWSWYKSTGNHDFDLFVRLFVAGDDNVFSTHPTYQSLYNSKTVGENLARIHMTYTPENKTDLSLGNIRPLTDVTFLKRGFRFCVILNRWVAPLNLQKVLEMPYWNRNFDDSITKEVVETVLTELSLHGKQVFDHYVPDILKAWSKVFGGNMGYPEDNFLILLRQSTDDELYFL